MSRPFGPDAPAVDTSIDETATGISAFLPILILALIFVAWFGFQATQLRMERDAMRDLTTNQEKQMQEAKKLRDALDAIARGTAQLADGGNANARLIVDELKRRGVTITPNGPAGGADPATPTPGPAK